MERQTFYEHIDNKNYFEALRALFDLIDKEPSLSNYSFVYSRLKELELSSLKLHNIRIAILSSFTFEPIIQYLYIQCYRANLKPEFYIGGYNLFQQEILDQASGLYKFNPEVLILAIGLEEISPKFSDHFLELSDKQIDDEIDIIETIKTLISSFRKQSNASMIIHNFEVPARSDFGIADFLQSHSHKNSIRKINTAVEEIARKNQGLYIIDYDGLASLYGKLSWQDKKMLLLAKMPISGKNCIHLANEYIRFLKPMKGLNRKCLVIDLDNTIWGGIVGEDGIDGIKIGRSYPGNAFLAFQKEILKLYNKGIILAVISKNNEFEAMEVFEKHPDMILKKEHFAGWRINWLDKVQNIKAIAKELNIGLDSMVFIDDSPVERELMKTTLPEVLTVNMPADPVQYCSVLRELTDFETLSLSDEDRKRGEMYRTQLERKKQQESFTSLDDFYKSLDMVATINLADSYSIPRISQLTQKTNQFNLTTKRYSESDISYFAESSDFTVLYIRLIDKFGDNGIVGVCIIKKHGLEWEIDTYLLSCRVLGRTVETAFLSFIIDIAKKEGAKLLYGTYIPTDKNHLAADFYGLHGFKLFNQSSEQVKWVFDLQNSDAKFPKWVKLETNYVYKRGTDNQ
jgi:FkbH-like protein